MRPMMHVWLEACEAVGLPVARVDKMKLAVVSPPWPQVGQQLTYLGKKWLVKKTRATRGMVFARPHEGASSISPLAPVKR